MVQDTVGPVFDTTCTTVFDFYTSLGSTCPAESELSIILNFFNGLPIPSNVDWTVGNNVIPAPVSCLTDNCSVPDSIQLIGSALQTSGDSCDFTYILTFSAFDQCGNFADVDFTYTINIHDDVPPVITCPLNVTVDCLDSTSPDSTGMATAIDECIGDVGITFSDSVAVGE